MLGNRGFPEAWSCLCVCQASFLMTFAMGGVPHAGSWHPPAILPPSIFPSIGVFSNESVLCIRRPNITVLASASVLPMNIQDWFPLGLTGLASLLSEGLSRVFSNTTIWKHQFFGAQPSLWPNSHIYTWLPEKGKTITLTTQTSVGKMVFLLFLICCLVLL